LDWLGRFNAQDTFSPFGVGGINPYVYCADDPINDSDPSGHMLTNVVDDVDNGVESVAKKRRLSAASDSGSKTPSTSIAVEEAVKARESSSSPSLKWPSTKTVVDENVSGSYICPRSLSTPESLTSEASLWPLPPEDGAAGLAIPRRTYQEVLDAAKTQRLTLTRRELYKFYGTWPDDDEVEKKGLLQAFIQVLSKDESRLTARELIDVPSMTQVSADLGFSRSYLTSALSEYKKAKLKKPRVKTQWRYEVLKWMGLLKD
jgi:hypothetical protein